MWKSRGRSDSDRAGGIEAEVLIEGGCKQVSALCNAEGSKR